MPTRLRGRGTRKDMTKQTSSSTKFKTLLAFSFSVNTIMNGMVEHRHLALVGLVDEFLEFLRSLYLRHVQMQRVPNPINVLFLLELWNSSQHHHVKQRHE